MSTAAQIGTESGRSRPAESLSQDVAFEMLSNQRRRYVLHALKQREQPVSLRELSTKIASWENEVEPVAVSYDQRTRVYTALRQSHLPKLDDAGVVRFDENAGTVELTDDASELEVYLDVVPHDEIPWSKYYLGLGGLSSGLVLVTLFEVFPFSLLPPTGCAALIALLLVGSATAHWYHDRQNRLGTEGPPPT